MHWPLTLRKGKKTEPLFDLRGRLLTSMAEADPRAASPEGIVAIGGGHLSGDSLRMAYRRGIFPWPHEGYPMLWFSPDPRAILNLDAVHVPKSLAKERRKSTLTFTIDRAFPQVIAACGATKRPDQAGTWITPVLRASFVRLHEEGMAHSVEAWNTEGELVGGLYGLDCGGVFTGESMFYREPYASKLALLYLFDHLRERGCQWIDIQTMTPHFQALGAIEVPREVFLERLAATQARNLSIFDPSPSVLQPGG